MILMRAMSTIILTLLPSAELELIVLLDKDFRGAVWITVNMTYLRVT